MLMFMLDLKGRRITIIGAGQVGARKVRFLSESGADVLVIGKEIGDDILSISGVRAITKDVDQDNFKDLLDGSFMVVVATDDRTLNRQISDHARQKGILVNVVDDPEACDVFFPSLVTRGPLVIAIGTSGASPSLSRFTRERIEEVVGPEYGLMAELHEAVRAELKQCGDDMELRRALLRKVLDSDQVWSLLKDGRTEEAERMARELIGR